jgi:hypothetical protein
MPSYIIFMVWNYVIGVSWVAPHISNLANHNDMVQIFPKNKVIMIYFHFKL